MTEEWDPIYVAARSGLLDTLEILREHRPSLILVGAQAVYLRVGTAGLDDIAPYTTDADLAIVPQLLSREATEVGRAMSEAGFSRGGQPGRWSLPRGTVDGTPLETRIDLMVPRAASGPSRRSARVDGLDPSTARNTRGIEAALFDRSPMAITSLDLADRRSVELQVAGTAALLVAKPHKIADRLADSGRRPKRTRGLGKDALDAHRILRREEPPSLAARLDELRGLDRDDVQRQTALVVEDAIEILRLEFSAPAARGAAATGGDTPSLVGEDLPRLTAAFARELLALL